MKESPNTLPLLLVAMDLTKDQEHTQALNQEATEHNHLINPVHHHPPTSPEDRAALVTQERVWKKECVFCF